MSYLFLIPCVLAMVAFIYVILAEARNLYQIGYDIGYKRGQCDLASEEVTPTGAKPETQEPMTGEADPNDDPPF